jgi:hypothetical protein
MLVVRPSGIQLANCQDSIGLILHELEPLGGRERQHPADQGQIDAILTIFRQRRITGTIFFGHDAISLDGGMTPGRRSISSDLTASDLGFLPW